MRLALFAAAMVASVSAGATAGVLDLRAPHIDTTALAGADTPSMCEPMEFNVYFEQGQARLSEPAERTLDVVSHQIKGCTIGSIGVEAAAADVVSADGRRVAGERGAAVLQALKQRGVTPDSIVVTKAGSPNEPSSAAPEHVTIAIDAGRAPLSVQQHRGLNDSDV